MTITYLYHSGFLVKSESCYLLFDYIEGSLPEMDTQKPLYIFSTHSHPDHFSTKIFEQTKNLNVQKFILSDDIFDIPEDIRHKVEFMGPNETKNIDGIEVQTLLSTDLGVAFLVQVDGKSIYHAGDLNCWVWNGATKEENKTMEEAYIQELKQLKGKNIDVAFLPLDPRQEDKYALGMNYFIQAVAAVKHIFPMHMWDKYDVISSYKHEFPQYAGLLEKITAPGQSFNI